MKLGIMQPYFFPYLGYFDLINCTDRWIVFDTPQYIRHGWVNRNRILHPYEGWQYIIAPLRKHDLTATIDTIQVLKGTKWRQKILAQVQHYKKRAPFFLKTHNLLQDCLLNDETSLARLNTSILAKVCGHLNIEFRYEFFSRMELHLDNINGPGDWALRISEALGASEYVNPPGGVNIFDPARFDAAKVKLTFRELPPLEYGCQGREFIPHLSIIDLLMWNSPEKIKEHLDAHRN